MALEDLAAEDKKSLQALDLLEQGIPGASVTTADLDRGVERGLYTSSRLAEAWAAYPAKRQEWSRTPPRPSYDPDRVGFIRDTLSHLLGDDGLTTENFAANRRLIEVQLFPTAISIGIPGIREIVAGYQGELVRSSGGPDNPSSGRLNYIKEHLGQLRTTVDKL